MSSAVVEVARELRRALGGFDASSLSGAAALALADELARTEKACAAARLMAAARAVGCGSHKDAGFADPARWVAQSAGTTVHEAKEALSALASLEACPATKDAVLAGEVSIRQAQEISKAAAELPGGEDALLEVARNGDLGKLRDEVRERRLASTPVGNLHRRQVAARFFRHWRDGLGMVCFSGALPPETGIPLVNRIVRDAARLRRETRRGGEPERFPAYAADAFVALTTLEGNARRGPSSDLVIVCDVFAWRRGHCHPGEPCHLIGGGPIPVDVAKELSEDAFLKVVLHDGKDIQKIRHVGRRYTAELRTALDLGPVPSFPGRQCADCGQRGSGQEYDHDDPVAHTGPTSYGNIKSRCYYCHAAKTERDRQAGLLGLRAKARPPVKRGGKGPRTEPDRRSMSRSSPAPRGPDPP